MHCVALHFHNKVASVQLAYGKELLIECSVLMIFHCGISYDRIGAQEAPKVWANRPGGWPGWAKRVFGRNVSDFKRSVSYGHTWGLLAVLCNYVEGHPEP